MKILFQGFFRQHNFSVFVITHQLLLLSLSNLLLCAFRFNVMWHNFLKTVSKVIKTRIKCYIIKSNIIEIDRKNIWYLISNITNKFLRWCHPNLKTCLTWKVTIFNESNFLMNELMMISFNRKQSMQKNLQQNISCQLLPLLSTSAQHNSIECLINLSSKLPKLFWSMAKLIFATSRCLLLLKRFTVCSR